MAATSSGAIRDAQLALRHAGESGRFFIVPGRALGKDDTMLMSLVRRRADDSCMTGAALSGAPDAPQHFADC
jgi:hypothetical protein